MLKIIKKVFIALGVFTLILLLYGTIFLIIWLTGGLGTATEAEALFLVLILGAILLGAMVWVEHNHPGTW